MKLIHFCLILQGFWSILVKRLRRKHFFSEKCYVCWKYPLLFIFNTKGEGSCISDLLIQQQNHVQMFTGFLFSFGSPVIRLGLRFPTIIQQSCCKETLRMVMVRFLVCFCQQQSRYCSAHCLLFIVLIFVRMQFVFLERCFRAFFCGLFPCVSGHRVTVSLAHFFYNAVVAHWCSFLFYICEAWIENKL